MSSKCCRSGVRAREGGQGHVLSGARWGRVPLPRRSARPDTGTGGLREVPRQHGVGVRVCCDAVASLDLRRVLCRSESDRAHTRPQTSHISLGRVSRASRSLTLSHSRL